MCKVRGPLCCSRCVEDTKRDSKAAEEFSAVGRTNEKQLETRFHDFPSLVNVQASAGNGAAIRPPQQVCSRISPQARRACLRPPCAEQPLCPDQTHLDPKGIIAKSSLTFVATGAGGALARTLFIAVLFAAVCSCAGDLLLSRRLLVLQLGNFCHFQNLGVDRKLLTSCQTPPTG